MSEGPWRQQFSRGEQYLRVNHQEDNEACTRLLYGMEAPGNI